MLYSTCWYVVYLFHFRGQMRGGPSVQRLIRSIWPAHIAYLFCLFQQSLKKSKIPCLLPRYPEQAGMCSQNFCIRAWTSAAAHTITPWVYKEKWGQIKHDGKELWVCKRAFFFLEKASPWTKANTLLDPMSEANECHKGMTHWGHALQQTGWE